MAEVSLKIGKKAEKDNVDPSKIAKGEKPTGAGGAEGQGYQSYQYVSCPYCWAVNGVTVDNSVWLGYYCWNCSGYFEV